MFVGSRTNTWLNFVTGIFFGNRFSLTCLTWVDPMLCDLKFHERGVLAVQQFWWKYGDLLYYWCSIMHTSIWRTAWYDRARHWRCTVYFLTDRQNNTHNIDIKGNIFYLTSDCIYHSNTLVISITPLDTNNKKTICVHYSNMWHDQKEWVECRPCCFWDIGKNSVQIPLF